ncbi:MAG: hypothetical protein ACRDBO_17960 [Lachnospiraceae bacterium]
MIEAHILTYIQAHKLYDTVDIVKTMDKLRKECTTEEIENFYKVLAVYNKVIEEDFKCKKVTQEEEE